MDAAFRIPLSTQRQRDKWLVKLFKLALREEFALVAPPERVSPRQKTSHLVAVAPLHRPFFKRVMKTEPGRIIGIYRFNGDHAALLTALMEDIRDAAAGLD